jgi:hypothetical protein
VISNFVNFLILVEWRQLRGGSVILSDEDATSKITNGWKKLNTLAHYGVKESAVMSLVPRKMTNCTMTNGHCKSSYRNCKIAACFTKLMMVTIFYFIVFGFQVLTLIISIQH